MHRNNKATNLMYYMRERKEFRYSMDGTRYRVMPNGEWRRDGQVRK